MENANSHSQRETNSTEKESLMANYTIIIGTTLVPVVLVRKEF